MAQQCSNAKLITFGHQIKVIFKWILLVYQIVIIIMIRVVVIFMIDDKSCFYLHQEHCELILIAIVVLVAYISNESNDTRLYQSLISHASTTLEQAIRKPSASHQLPLTEPSLTPQQGIRNTASTSHFRLILFIVNLPVVCCFSDVYMNIIDCSFHNMDTIIFKLIKFLSEMTLSMAKQSQYWCFEICNVIEFSILWNYSSMFETIVYNCINWGIGKNTTKYKMDQTCIISCNIIHIDPPAAHINILSILNESSMIEIKIVNYNQFDLNACAAIEFYQNANEMNDFYLTVAIISAIDTMKHAMEILVVICAIISICIHCHL